MNYIAKDRLLITFDTKYNIITYDFSNNFKARLINNCNFFYIILQFISKKIYYVNI